MRLLLALALLQQVEIPPPPRGFGTATAEIVVDQVGVLSGAAVNAINQLAFEVHAKTGGEIAVVVMRDIGGRSDSEIALRIGREWGIGSDAPVGNQARNAGVVVLVVPKETALDGRGRVRIETGRGVEGFITDGTAGDIQRAAIPYFQQADYDRAVLLIVASIANRFATEFGVTLDPGTVPAVTPVPARSPRGGAFPPEVIFFLLFVAFMILSGAGRMRGGRGNGCLTLLWLLSASSHGRRGHWGGGGWGGGGFGGGSFGGGGGFGGFGGGGGFSGGGSSGSW